VVLVPFAAMHSCHNQNITHLLDQGRGQRAEGSVVVVKTLLRMDQTKLDQADCSKASSVSPDSQIQTRIIPMATVEVEVIIVIRDPPANLDHPPLEGGLVHHIQHGETTIVMTFPEVGRRNWIRRGGASASVSIYKQVLVHSLLIVIDSCFFEFFTPLFNVIVNLSSV